MTIIFVSRIPKGLKHGPVSRIIKQGIETVAQVQNIWVQSNKGYAFVKLYCESSMDVVLTLDNKIEVNRVPLKLERSKSTIGERRQQKTKKQMQLNLSQNDQQHNPSNRCSSVGYHTYAEYQRDRPKTETSHTQAAVPSRKLKQMKPWKRIKIQPSAPPLKPRHARKASTCFEHYRKQNYHYVTSKCTSTKTCVKPRNGHLCVLKGSPSDCLKHVVEDITTDCDKDTLQRSTPPTKNGNSSFESSDYLPFRKRVQRKPVPSNAISRYVRAHVYHNSKYLFNIDVDNKNTFESIQTAICRKHVVPIGSLLLFYNGTLLNKAVPPTICDDDNIHITVKGVGGMNEDGSPKPADEPCKRVEAASQSDTASLHDEDENKSFGDLLHSFEQKSVRQRDTTTKYDKDKTKSLSDIVRSFEQKHVTGTPTASSRRSLPDPCDDLLSVENRIETNTHYSPQTKTTDTNTDKSSHLATSQEPRKQETLDYPEENPQLVDEFRKNELEIRTEGSDQTLIQKQQDTAEKEYLFKTELDEVNEQNKNESEAMLSAREEEMKNMYSKEKENKYTKQKEGIGGMNQDDPPNPMSDQFKGAQVRRPDKAMKCNKDVKQSVGDMVRVFEHQDVTGSPKTRHRRSSPKPYSPTSDSDYDKELEGELRIVLIGKTGVGKSATGNTILGGDVFKSLPSGSSVTHKCKSGQAERFGRKIYLVDTPGIYDTDVNNRETKSEVIRLVNMTLPGPHALILVVAIGRFTDEDHDTVKELLVMKCINT